MCHDEARRAGLWAGNHEPALSAANRVIAISGLREDAHRHQWMKELQMEGLRKAGLREE